MTAGVDANMQAAALAFDGQRFKHVDVRQGFAAGKSDSAAGLFVKNLIGEELVQRVAGGKGLAGDLPGILQTKVDATAAGLAAIPVSQPVLADGLAGAMGTATTAL
jgi:hypothetical protein